MRETVMSRKARRAWAAGVVGFAVAVANVQGMEFESLYVTDGALAPDLLGRWAGGTPDARVDAASGQLNLGGNG
jgi:hypothetical protein